MPLRFLLGLVRPRDINWWYVLALVGVAGMVVSAAGEILGWWKDGGEWGFWASLGLTIIGMTLGASRVQVGRIEGSAGRLERSSRRVEDSVGRVEGRAALIQQNTANLEGLLVEIRDELRRRP